MNPVNKTTYLIYLSTFLAIIITSCSFSPPPPKTPDLRDQLLEALSIPQALDGDHLGFDKTLVEDRDAYRLFRIVLYPRPGDSIPMHYLEPHHVVKPYPLMICLQGHAPGMYISIGETKSARDEKLVAGGRDLALQAVENGWAALTIEQRGFGEQAEEISCNHLSLNLAMEGKTMVGQRVSDVSIALDYLENHEEIRPDKVACIGNSAGGTISYFASTIDTRIGLAVVSCSFSTYAKSWLKYPHCACGYVPGLLEFADMPDLAALISPRALLLVAGKEDYLADIEGVRDGFMTAKRLYEEVDAIDQLALVEGEGGHQFYPDLAWPYIQDFLEHGRFID